MTLRPSAHLPIAGSSLNIMPAKPPSRRSVADNWPLGAPGRRSAADNWPLGAPSKRSAVDNRPLGAQGDDPSFTDRVTGAQWRDRRSRIVYLAVSGAFGRSFVDSMAASGAFGRCSAGRMGGRQACHLLHVPVAPPDESCEEMLFRLTGKDPRGREQSCFESTNSGRFGMRLALCISSRLDVISPFTIQDGRTFGVPFASISLPGTSAMRSQIAMSS